MKESLQTPGSRDPHVRLRGDRIGLAWLVLGPAAALVTGVIAGFVIVPYIYPRLGILIIVLLTWFVFGLGVGIVGLIGILTNRLARYMKTLAATYLGIAITVGGVTLWIAREPIGHDRLSIAIHNLDLPGSPIEIAERRGGPQMPFFGDSPHVSVYYVSAQDPDQTCAALRSWALDNGLTDDSRPVESILRVCAFYGQIDSNWIDVHVSSPMDEIPDRYGVRPITTDIAHEAVIEVGMTAGR